MVKNLQVFTLAVGLAGTRYRVFTDDSKLLTYLRTFNGERRYK
jgi:hypothetical protein